MLKTNSPLIALTAIIYAALVFISEITFGNPAFPIHFWEFTKIASWKWSVPVHMGGFVWLVFWNATLKNQSLIWPVLASVSFFVVAEVANRQVFHFFLYSEQPLGQTTLF